MTARFAAYSCGGSRGIGDKIPAPHSLFIPTRGNRQSHLGLPTRQSQCAGATLLPPRPTSLEIGMEGETFLWLIRHAPVDGVKGTIHAADAPADLGDRVQLEALRQRLPPDAASFASPARRTVETARALGLEPALVPELSEQDFGDWTGRRHDELAATGGETYAQFWSDPAHGRGRRAAKVLRIRSRASGWVSPNRRRLSNARRAFRHHPRRALHCAGSDTTSGLALRDRSVVTDPDRPARHRLARRRGQSARGLSRVRPGDPAHWPARRSPCRCEGCTRAAPAAARWRHPILRRA